MSLRSCGLLVPSVHRQSFTLLVATKTGSSGGGVVSAARQNDIPSLTGFLRVAACSVLLAHAWLFSFVWDGVRTFEPAAQRLSHFGMTLFFVLSGFVIEYNYAALL